LIIGSGWVGENVAFNSIRARVGVEDVDMNTLGNIVGTAVVTRLKVVGAGTFVALSDGGSISQGVLGKQARPFGHSDDDPLGQGLVQLLDASRKSTPQKNELFSEQGV
jgi:hypothetical protein